jgi:dTDP-4-dehydrorhamnose reductase
MYKPLVVVIGGNGQLGTDIVKALSNDYTIKSLTHQDIDITKKSCYEALCALGPAYVINTAAYHNLKLCEENPDQAFLVNSWGALNIARACKDVGAVAVYISTDHVFSGMMKTPYNEYHITEAVNAYGKSKILGERLTQECLGRNYILRVSTLYGNVPPSGKPWNFMDFVVQKALKKEKLQIINTLICTPTFTQNAANKVLYILKRHLPHGIYHCSDEGATTFYDVAHTVCKYLSLEANIEPISIPIDNVPRPQYCAMISDKLFRHGCLSRSWEESLYEYLDNKYSEHIKQR